MNDSSIQAILLLKCNSDAQQIFIRERLHCYRRGIAEEPGEDTIAGLAASLRATTACKILMSSDRRSSMLLRYILLRSMLRTLCIYLPL